MSLYVCVYAAATGRILRTVICEASSAEVQADADAGEDWIYGEASDVEHYVVEGEITARATITPSYDDSSWEADGSSTLTVSGLPTGASVAWVGPDSATGTLTATSGSVTLATNVPGDYVLTIDEVAYLPTTITVTAAA